MRRRPLSLAFAFLCAACSSETAGGGSGGAATTGPGGGTGQLGSPCSADADCASAICTSGGICTATCSGAGDCPAGPEWTCAPLPPHGDVCQCTAVGAETCDGTDEDCNGVVDDGATCHGGGACVSGQCSCPPEQTCGGACVDLTSDLAHCGSCEVACPPGAKCTASRCVCDGGQTACSDACVDLQTDPKHCGDCDTACNGGSPCMGGTCQCAGTQCGSACVDVQNDADNCGSCDHGCLGGTCAGGFCQPVPVDTDPNHGAWFPTTDATNVYFTSEFDVIKAGLDGSNLEVLATDAFGGLRSIAVDATDLYIASISGPIEKIPKGGGTLSTIAMGTAPWAIAVDATHVFWSDPDAVRRIDKDGQNPVEIASGLDGAYGMAIDAAHVFWTTNGAGDVQRANLDGTGATTLATGQTDAFALAVDATKVYWLRLNGGGIYSLDKTGAGVPKLLTPALYAWGLAVDASGVYWSAASTIVRTDPATSTDQVIASAGGAEGLALAADRVFWCDANSPVLAYVAK